MTSDSLSHPPLNELTSGQVLKVTATGTVSTLIGTSGQFGFQPGSLPGVISSPAGLAISGNTLYFSLPNGIGQGFSLYVNAITQAPPPVPDAAVTLALGDTIDEAMNTIQLAGTDWNDAVKAYNTRRAQIKGEIVARVSAYFGFDLPVTFPYYQGGNAGQPVQNPLATPIP